MYKIESSPGGGYVVLDDAGKFVLSADTYREAEKEIAALEDGAA